MSLEAAIYSHLSGHPTVSAIVSDRVYPVRRPQGSALPAIVYTRRGGFHSRHMLAHDGLVNVDLEIECQAATYAGAKALAEAARQTMAGLRNKTIGSLNIRSCFLDDDTDGESQPLDSSDVTTRWVAMTFTVWYVESVPSFV